MGTPLVRFAHITDTHINPDMNYATNYTDYPPLPGTLALLRILSELPVALDFILHTGDVVYDPDPTAYEVARQLFGELGLPTYFVAGNHDDRYAVQTALMGRSHEDLQEFPHGEVEISGVQLVLVDTNGPAELPAGSITLEQLEWLDRLCSVPDERPMVIALHHNVVEVGTPWLDNWMRTTNGADFHAIVRQARDRLRGVFHGHIHQNVQVLRDGVLYVSAASSWNQFNSFPSPANIEILRDDVALPGFNLVTITSEETIIKQYVYNPFDEGYYQG